MKRFNTVVLNITVAILDFLYKGRDYPRFWVLEEIARAPICFSECVTFSRKYGTQRT